MAPMLINMRLTPVSAILYGMTPSAINTDLFLLINRFAERTSWLHSFFKLIANYGIVVFVGLIIAGWLYARRHEISKMGALVWTGFGTLIAVGVNQPIVNHFHEARPYSTLSHILVLAHRSADYGFPSDHSTMAGAITAGLFLVNPLLGIVSLAFALLLAFSRVYISAHYPYDVAAGLILGAAIVFIGYFIVRKPLIYLLTKLVNTPLRPLIAANPRENKLPELV